jgi:hypothetical protein
MVVKTDEQAAEPITGRVVLFRMTSDQYEQLPVTPRLYPGLSIDLAQLGS